VPGAVHIPPQFSVLTTGIRFICPILAEPPSYVLRPQYKTRAQKQSDAMEQGIAELSKLLQAMQSQNESIKTALEENTAAVRDLSSWRPHIEADVGDLRVEMSQLSAQVKEMAAIQGDYYAARKVFDEGSEEQLLSKNTQRETSLLPAGQEHDAYGAATANRGAGFGVVTTLTPPPVKGNNLLPHLGFSAQPLNQAVHSSLSPYSANLAAALPNMSFPQFDGHHPKMWKVKSESYFEVFAIPSELWVKIATMNFVGSAAFWLQSMDPALRLTPWLDFCSAVCARFERDHHNHLIRQFFRIKQYTNVTEYVEQFDSLMHQILAHDPSFSMSAIVNRFVDGLRQDIKAVVFIQRPLDLDTVVSLALLQEELLSPRVQQQFKRSEDQRSSSNTSGFLPTSFSTAQISDKLIRSPETNFRTPGDCQKPEYRDKKSLCSDGV
jgi:hypothetical protein